MDLIFYFPNIFTHLYLSQIIYTFSHLQTSMGISLKAFDFFRKIRSEQQLSSATGGFFTIGSLIVAGILVILSIQDYTSIHYVTSLRIRNDPTEYIPMKIDILFNKAPCSLIQLRFNDELEYSETNLEKKLKLTNIEGPNQSPFTWTQNRQQQIRQSTEGLDRNIGCRLQGTLNLPKTPGTLTFQLNGPDNLIYEINTEARSKVKSNYLLKKLEFGEALKPFELPVTHSSLTVENYIKKLEGNIASRTIVQDFQNKQERLNFYNHLKIIPIYVDDGIEKSEKDRQKYRYSLRSGNTISRQIAPSLQIYTQIQPINIIYTKNDMTLYDLSVDILAIAGGSVATIGVINALYHYLFVSRS